MLSVTNIDFKRGGAAKFEFERRDAELRLGPALDSKAVALCFIKMEFNIVENV